VRGPQERPQLILQGNGGYMQTREEDVVNTVEEKIQKEFWDTIDLINSFKGREEELVEKDPRYQAAHLEMLKGFLQVVKKVEGQIVEKLKSN
jgi:hypothetical protein